MNEMTVTSLETLQVYSQGCVIRLPDTAPGRPLYVRMKRPSLLDLISHGKIPNPLASAAGSLFSKGGASIDTKDSKQMRQLVELLHIFAEEAFIEPTYQQMKEVGYELTDEQLMFVFNYIQKGNKVLEPFRQEQKGVKPTRNVAKVQENTGGAAQHNG